MEKINISDVIQQFKNEVCYYNQMQLYSMLPSEKNYYLSQIEERTQDVIMQILSIENQNIIPSTNEVAMPSTGEEPVPSTSEETMPSTVEEPVPSTSEETMPSIGEEPVPSTSDETMPSIGEEPVPSTEEGPIPTGEEPIPTTIVNESQPSNANSMEQKEFTVAELSKFNGNNGNPAYVAVNGIVYDVTNVVLWAGGRHNGLLAGKDLSAAYLGCHLGMPERLEKLTKVGKLKR